jgi:hypothetical protein
LSLLVLLSVCLFLVGACGKGTPYYKDAQANASPTPASTPKPDDSKPFREAAAELTKVPGTVRLSGDGYFKGKAVRYVQNISLAANDRAIMWTVDPNLLPVAQAETPTEVETVVLQKCVEVSMGTFVQSFGVANGNEKIPAFGWKCDVTIIDKTIPAVVGRKSFESEIKERELVSEGSKELRRSPPLVAIENFLKTLPKK